MQEYQGLAWERPTPLSFPGGVVPLDRQISDINVQEHRLRVAKQAEAERAEQYAANVETYGEALAVVIEKQEADAAAEEAARDVATCPAGQCLVFQGRGFAAQVGGGCG